MGKFLSAAIEYYDSGGRFMERCPAQERLAGPMEAAKRSYNPRAYRAQSTLSSSVDSLVAKLIRGECCRASASGAIEVAVALRAGREHFGAVVVLGGRRGTVGIRRAARGNFRCQ